MTGPVSRVRLAALAAIVALTAACGGVVTTGGDPGVPREGGTLQIVGSGDIDHLDPASAYYVPTWKLQRAITRQLVTYPYSRLEHDIDDDARHAKLLARFAPRT